MRTKKIWMWIDRCQLRWCIPWQPHHAWVISLEQRLVRNHSHLWSRLRVLREGSLLHCWSRFFSKVGETSSFFSLIDPIVTHNWCTYPIHNSVWRGSLKSQCLGDGICSYLGRHPTTNCSKWLGWSIKWNIIGLVKPLGRSSTCTFGCLSCCKTNREYLFIRQLFMILLAITDQPDCMHCT